MARLVMVSNRVIDFNAAQMRPTDGFYQPTMQAHVEIALRSSRDARSLIPDLNRKPNPRDSFLGLHPALGLVVRPPRVAAPPSGGEADLSTGESLGWKRVTISGRTVTDQMVPANNKARVTLILSVFSNN